MSDCSVGHAGQTPRIRLEDNSTTSHGCSGKCGYNGKASSRFFFSLSLLSSPSSLLLPGALFLYSWRPLEGREGERRWKR